MLNVSCDCYLLQFRRVTICWWLILLLIHACCLCWWRYFTANLCSLPSHPSYLKTDLFICFNIVAVIWLKYVLCFDILLSLRPSFGKLTHRLVLLSHRLVLFWLIIRVMALLLIELSSCLLDFISLQASYQSCMHVTFIKFTHISRTILSFRPVIALVYLILALNSCMVISRITLLICEITHDSIVLQARYQSCVTLFVEIT